MAQKAVYIRKIINMAMLQVFLSLEKIENLCGQRRIYREIK